MTLILPDGQPFTTGATAYQYRPATAQESTPRITLEVAIEGVVTHAMVDTGGDVSTLFRTENPIGF